MPPAAGCCRGFFCLIGKFFDFPIRQKNPSGRIALRRKGIMLLKATRRRRRILQSRILFDFFGGNMRIENERRKEMKEKKSGQIFAAAQQIGKSLFLPIAVLPFAGILLGVGSTFTNETTIATQ